MKTIARVMLGTVCIWLTGIVSAYGTFSESYNLDVNLAGWTVAGEANITAITPPYPNPYSTACAYIKPLASVSMSAGAGTKVITDFWTQPNPVTGEPATATDASVQFAFQGGAGNGGGANSVWVLHGSAWENVSAGATVGSGTWIHVTVIQEYTGAGAGTWSLKINDSTVASGKSLHDIGQTTYASFSVENSVGDEVHLDDVKIVANDTESLGAALAAGNAYIASADLDPIDPTKVKVVTTAPLAYKVKVTTDYAGDTEVAGSPFTLVTDDGGGKRVDTSLTLGDNLYYRLVVSADSGANSATELAPSFAVHQQDRSGLAGSSYWVGSMIDYASGDNNLSVGAALGNQLKRGLTGGDDATSGDNVIVYDPVNGKRTYWLSGVDTSWYTGASTPADNDPISVGSAFLIQTKNDGGTTKAVFAGPQIDNGVSSFTHAMPIGWFMFSYPLEGTKTISSLSGGVTTGDLMYLYRGGSFKLLKKFSGGWRTYTGGALPAGYTDLQFGEGVFYFSPGTTLTLK